MVLWFLLVASSRNNGTHGFLSHSGQIRGLWEEDGTGHEGLCFGFGSVLLSHLSLSIQLTKRGGAIEGVEITQRLPFRRRTREETP